MQQEIIQTKRDEIIKAAKLFVSNLSRAYGVDILSKSRAMKVLLPRQVLVDMFRCELKFSTIMVGEIFNLNHSTVIHCTKCCDRAKDLKDEHSVLMNAYRESFLPHVKDFRRKMLESSETLGTLVAQDREIVEEKVKRLERSMIEQMRLVSRIVEEKKTLLDSVSEYKKMYLDMKNLYESSVSKEDRTEVERMKSYV